MPNIAQVVQTCGRARNAAARKPAWRCAAASAARSGHRPESHRSPASAVPASVSPTICFADNPVEPKIGTSWRSYPGSARTRAPLPAGCAPRAAHTGEPPHRPPLETPLAIPFGLRKGQLLKRPAFAPPPAPMPPRGRLFQRRARFPEGGTERCSPVLYGIYHTPLRLRLNPSRTTIDLPHPMF